MIKNKTIRQFAKLVFDEIYTILKTWRAIYCKDNPIFLQ